MSRVYHSLCILEEGVWFIHFGDYDKNVVKGEQDYMVESGTPRRRTQVLTTGDTQAAVEQAVDELNRRRTQTFSK